MSFIVLDYETRSEIDLKTAGAFDYAWHPTTQIICASYRVDTKMFSWCPLLGEPVPNNLRSILIGTRWTIVAHNAFFEWCITNAVLRKILPMSQIIPFSRFTCTAARSAALALPRSLEGACEALGLKTKKDMEGRRLVLKYCKPRKATKNNSEKWHNDKNELKRLVKYCETDVNATTELYLKTNTLNSVEKDVWLLDQKINARGFEVDRPLVDKILGLIVQEEKTLIKETKEIVDYSFDSPKQVAKTLDFIKAVSGVSLPNLQAKTVSDAMEMIKNPTARRILEIRQDLSRASTAKYKAFKLRSERDSRARDNLVYWGASTGRWAGRGIQIQNLPRPVIKDYDTAIDLVKDGDLELIRLVYGSPMRVFSSLLRSVIVPSSDRLFYCGDYSAIEARVLFWIARHDAGIKAYEDSRDLYREIATRIYGVPLDTVTGEQRDVGKRAILGCGYGMGAKKFQATCELFGQPVSSALAETAVDAYRTTHFPVPKLWSNLENAARKAIENPSTIIGINRTKWSVSNGFLWCELPSGRRLAYAKPSIKEGKTPWGEDRLLIHHWAVNPKTKKWENGSTYGGKLTENVVQAVARDIMAQAMLRVENAGFEVVLSVHDELLCEGYLNASEKRLEQFTQLMNEAPEWAKGLPIKVDAWCGNRYRK